MNSDTVHLSQCMIVKNEEKNIERALSWGKGFVWEQIVVDTGSTDRTVEIAKQLGAKVCHFPWKDDFSAAKNFAIGQATGNWIAFLDADEYFQSGDAKKILELLNSIERNPTYKDVHIVSNRMVHLNDEGTVFASSAQDRIFRNRPDIRYKNKIHEELYKISGKGLVRMDAADLATIIHTGYASSIMEEKKKRERNISMIKKGLETEPDNYLLMSYLGDAYISADQKREAEDAFTSVLEHIGSLRKMERVKATVAALMQIVVERNQSEEDGKLLTIYKKGKALLPQDADLDYWMGVWSIRRFRWQDAIHHFKKCLKEQETQHQEGPSYVLGKLEDIYYLLTLASQRLDRKQDMVKYGVLTLRVNRYNEEILSMLLALFLSDPSTQGQEDQVFSLLKQIYDFTRIKDKMYVYKSAKLLGFTKLLDDVYHTFTREEKDWLES